MRQYAERSSRIYCRAPGLHWHALEQAKRCAVLGDRTCSCGVPEVAAPFRILALDEVGKDVLCRRCRLQLRGRATTERDHVIGRQNSSTTVLLDANVHAVLTRLQSGHPRKLLRNPGPDEAVRRCALLRRTLDAYALGLHNPEHPLGGALAFELESMLFEMEDDAL